MFYLIEPYNAYQRPAKKKHPSEIAEEERLYFETLRAEEQRSMKESREANFLGNTKDSRTFHLAKDDGDLPDARTANGHGVGAGGSPPYQFFNPHIILAFTSSVVSGHVPFQVQFTNLESGDIQFITYNWNFGDGTTSTQVNPKHTYNKTGSFDISLTGSAQGNSSVISFLRTPNYISSSN